MRNKIIASLFVLILGTAVVTRGQTDIHIWPIRGNVHMMVGGGANIVVSIGPDGVLLVDTGGPQATDKVLAAVEQLQNEFQRNLALISAQTPFRGGALTRSVLPLNTIPPAKPIQFIINTSADPDHTGGNAKVSTSGGKVTGGNVASDIRDAAASAEIIAHDNVLKRMSGEPFAAQPTSAYTTPSMKLSYFFNGEGIQIFHTASAHTDGDSIVHFRGSDVIAAGDVFSTLSYPVIDLERGGSIQGVIDSLNRLLDLAIPEFRSQGGTLVVPGHGRLSDTADVGYYRDMVTIIRDRIQDMVKNGRTLEEVKAARPTLDYDPRYGKPDAFIEAVYRSLVGKKS
jgi:glyoxylase-like metal-dependent hydrolase (beta-lactamase superfamily II)